MKNIYRILAAILLVISHVTFSQIKPNILVYSEIGQYRDTANKTPGFYHASIPEGVKMFNKMGLEHNFNVKATSNSDDFTDAGLAAFQVVVFLNPNGYYILSPDNRKAFVKFLASGKGYVGIHAASNCEKDWPFYKDLMGTFEEGVEADQNGEVLVNQRDHISTISLPAKFTIKDEWLKYSDNIYALDPKYSVLLSVNESSYRSSNKTHPISWYHEFGGGRVWYTGLGHNSSTYTNQNFINHVWGGIQFALGSPNTAINPNLFSNRKNGKMHFNQSDHYLKIYLPEAGPLNILAFDMKGRLVFEEYKASFNEGWNTLSLPLSGQRARGNYLFKISQYTP
jgi:uncharacterized protein